MKDRSVRIFKVLIIFLIWAGMQTSLYPAGNGGFAGSYLRMGLGARALSMGNAQVAVAKNGFGAFYNPALLPSLPQPVLSLSYSFLSLDRRFNYIGFAMPLKPFAGFSVGWIYSGVDNIRAYNSRGEDVGAINHGLHAIYFSFGFNLIQMIQKEGKLAGLPSDLLSLGINMKYVREGLNDNADFNYVGKGFGFDIGVFLKPTPFMQLGYQIKDINAKLKSNTDKIFERGTTTDNKFPLIQKVGMFWQTPLTFLSVAYDFEWSNKGSNKHHIGAELRTTGLAGRIGYNNNHLTFGGGLDFRMFKNVSAILDYAFIDDIYDEGVSHVFSWQFTF